MERARSSRKIWTRIFICVWRWYGII